MSDSSSSGGSDASRGFLRISRGDLERRLQEEKIRRRHRRLQQVRKKSSDMAKKVRERARQEQWQKMEEITQEQLEKYRQKKQVELILLEEEYQRCLEGIGMGHAAVQRATNLEHEIQQQREGQRLRAEARGAEALKKEKRRRKLAEKAMENQAAVKKSALLAERIRSLDVQKRLAQRQKVELVEVDENARKKVTLVDRRKLMKAVSPRALKKGMVRRVPLSEVSKNGLEAAIREQEVEQRKTREEEERLRREQELQRQKEYEDIQKKLQDTSSSSYTDEPNMLSTILEEDENSKTTQATQTPRER